MHAGTRGKHSWLLLSGLLIFLACGAWMMFGAGSPPVVMVRVVGPTNDSSGVPMVLFEVTNGSTNSLIYGYQTQIKSNRQWMAAPSQVGSLRVGQPLPGKSSRTFTLPQPREGAAWRALVRCSRPASLIEAHWDNLKKRLGARSTRTPIMNLASAEIGNDDGAVIKFEIAK